MDDRLRLLLLAFALFAAIPLWFALLRALDSRSERPRPGAAPKAPPAMPKPKAVAKAAPAPKPAPAPPPPAKLASPPPAPKPAPPPISSAVPKIDPDEPPAPPREIVWTVVFAPGAFELDRQAERQLAAAAETLLERSLLSIVLQGTYAPGEAADPKVGRALARARVKTVQDALENAGLTTTYLPRLAEGDAAVRIEVPRHGPRAD